MKTVVVACFALVGCAAGSPDPTEGSDPTRPGACGDATTMGATLAGRVEDEGGAALEGVEVLLEERTWSPGTVHAAATTSAGGAFELVAADLPVVEGCWGTAVAYWLTAADDAVAGEKHVTGYLEDAWEAGSDRVELPVPLVLR